MFSCFFCFLFQRSCKEKKKKTGKERKEKKEKKKSLFSCTFFLIFFLRNEKLPVPLLGEEDLNENEDIPVPTRTEAPPLQALYRSLSALIRLGGTGAADNG